jgi:hypothetical protein
MTIESTFGERAAVGALLAIRAATPGSDATDELLILPDMMLSSHQQVASRLARERKPITCVGVHLNNVLAIGWWPSVAEEARGRRQIIERLLLAPLLQSEPGRAKEIILVASGSRLPLSYEELRTLMMDYSIPFAHFHIEMQPDGDGVSETVAEVHVSPTSLPRFQAYVPTGS